MAGLRETAAGRRERVTCSVCGAEPPLTPAFTIRGFAIVRCPACRVLRVSPRLCPEDLQAYYDNHYWKSTDAVTRGYADYAGDEANIRKTFRRRLAWLESLTGGSSPEQPKAWLDVGCAFGFLLQEARAAGWEVRGLEWSAFAAARAHPDVRPTIAVAGLGQNDLPEASFDLVTCWDYLEHSPDPKADLSAAARLLKPGGWLSIIIPDAGSWLAKLMGPAWEEFKKPEEHLYFFTARQLQALAWSTGFQLVRQAWAGKYARLDFAFSRFKPGDGWLYPVFRAAAWLAARLGWQDRVFYINPRDKRHLLFRKTGPRPGGVS